MAAQKLVAAGKRGDDSHRLAGFRPTEMREVFMMCIGMSGDLSPDILPRTLK